MKIIFVFYFCLILGVSSCNTNQTNSSSQTEDAPLEIEMIELEFENRDSLNSILSHLDSVFHFLLENESEINVLYVTQISDSVLFNFSIFPKDCIQLLVDKFTNIKMKGYLQNDENNLLFIFDDVGIFESKENVIRSFNFGYQEKEYPLLFEPPLYRYYLNNKNQLTFLVEGWFLHYY